MKKITAKRVYKRSVALVLLVILVCAAQITASAVVLDDENQLSIILSGGMNVRLLGEATSTPGVKSHNYYYLPVNLRLSARPDGTPEFLFLKFTTEQRGGVSGGLMHFLMEWGLTPELEAELKTKLRALDESAQLMGAVPLQADGESGSFQIVSATLSDRTLTPTVVTSGKAPLVPGGKVAAAARLSADGAQLLAATLERARSITDASLAVNYSYATLAPAARGFIEFNWSKLEKEKDTLRAEYKRTQTGTTSTSDCFIIFCASSERPEYKYSYNEVRNQYKFLEEKQIVRIQFDETAPVPDERVAKIREAFFQYFLNMMAQPADQQGGAPPPPVADKDKEKTPDIRQGSGYKYNVSSFKRAFERKYQRVDLNYRTTLKNPLQIVGNLASWYVGVRDNPKCVGTVNLNDPFFQHRSINFILDLDAKDMFEEAINYVTVNVRKRRSDGRPFEDRVTIDQKYVKDKGINATVTYARGEDTNPDLYEYQAQWSLRGGKIYPAAPAWQQGTWEGVTLSAPVVPRTIEAEADLEALKASDITRVTVQIHYRKFGEEAEENIQISPAEGKPIVQRRIFMDRNARGYAYRLVLNHKTLGKLALPWNPQVGDNYIYANISPDMLKQPSIVDAAKEAGKTAINSATERVLEKFAELVGEKLP